MGCEPLHGAGGVRWGDGVPLERLAVAVRQVPDAATDAGGTTLRDYVRTDGAAGEFVGRLSTYGREGEPRPRYAAPITRAVIGQRSAWFCRKRRRLTHARGSLCNNRVEKLAMGTRFGAAPRIQAAEQYHGFSIAHR